MSEDNRERLFDEEVEETTEIQNIEEPEVVDEEGSAKEDIKEITPDDKKKKIAKEVLNWVITIVAALVCAIIINIYFFRISQVNGSSMENTYYNGNTVIVSRIPYLFGGDAKRGDVIVFDAQQIAPGERTFWDDYSDVAKYNAFALKFNKNLSLEHKYYIKRVIGLPGDTIEIKEDGLYINGELYEEDYIRDQDWESRYAGQSWTVSEDCYFVMGDNRMNSKDSRIIGEISRDCVLGKVLTKGKN